MTHPRTVTLGITLLRLELHTTICLNIHPPDAIQHGFLFLRQQRRATASAVRREEGSKTVAGCAAWACVSVGTLGSLKVRSGAVNMAFLSTQLFSPGIRFI